MPETAEFLRRVLPYPEKERKHIGKPALPTTSALIWQKRLAMTIEVVTQRLMAACEKTLSLDR